MIPPIVNHTIIMWALVIALQGAVAFKDTLAMVLPKCSPVTAGACRR